MTSDLNDTSHPSCVSTRLQILSEIVENFGFDALILCFLEVDTEQITLSNHYLGLSSCNLFLIGTK